MLPVPDLSNEEWTILETLFSRAENAAARPGRWLVRQGAKALLPSEKRLLMVVLAVETVRSSVQSKSVVR